MSKKPCKPKPRPKTKRLASAVTLLALALAGCAETKPGQTITGYQLVAQNPGNAGSQAILGPDGSPTILSGQGSVESSIADSKGWQETNQGGQSKVRRYSRIELADGNAVTLYESNPANEELGELVIAAPGGSFEKLTVKGRATDLARVQGEVVALYTQLAPVWIKATEAERDAIIQKLKSQEAVSKAAIDQVVPLLQAVRLAVTGGV